MNRNNNRLYWQTVVLSEEALQRIVSDMWLPEEDLKQIQLALENIRLEREYDNTKPGVTPWGQSIESFRNEFRGLVS